MEQQRGADAARAGTQVAEDERGKEHGEPLWIELSQEVSESKDRARDDELPAQGSHDELLARGGQYAAPWRLQTGESAR